MKKIEHDRARICSTCGTRASQPWCSRCGGGRFITMNESRVAGFLSRLMLDEVAAEVGVAAIRRGSRVRGVCDAAS